MPKLKTHKGAKARFRVTPNGKLLRTKGGSSHLRRNKSKTVKRQYHGLVAVSSKDRVRVSRLIPYGA
ncbi:MAG: 50S ribosomal protein L35 [Dehalococcoidia bacterium]|nr:50S ribosomal protein L35 [Dehalococcoidia bacterium]